MFILDNIDDGSLVNIYGVVIQLLIPIWEHMFILDNIDDGSLVNS
jgi:hypothetical protein